MSVLIVGSAIRTCFGDGTATFSALLNGISGVSELRSNYLRPKITHGYAILEENEKRLFSASRLLTTCASEALAQSGIDPAQQRVVAIVGTGLRELISARPSRRGNAIRPCCNGTC